MIRQRHDYIVASRQGLYIVNHAGWRQVAEGRFFGVTVRDDRLYAFRNNSPSPEQDSETSGSILGFHHRDGELQAPETLVEGLDANCHQIDYFDGAFFVVDTFHQRILEYDGRWRQIAIRQIAPPAARDSPDHVHVNSFLGVNDAIYLMLHNHARGIPSALKEYDRNFVERRTIALPLSGCHDIARLENGRILYCLSQAGQIALDDGTAFEIDQYWTRGLSVGPDEIAVGSSLFGTRIERALLPGFVTFLDRQYRRQARIYLPAAPTQIRRLDGIDLSLSRPR